MNNIDKIILRGRIIVFYGAILLFFLMFMFFNYLKIDNIIIDLANIHSLSFLKKESINGKQHYFYNQLIYLSDMVDLKVFLKTENMI